MLLLGMLFGLLVLGPALMLLVFAILSNERAMGILRRLAPRRHAARTTAEGEPASPLDPQPEV